MRTELFIAWRYLRSRRKGFFALLTTSIAVAGITLGVAALIITLAVMTGFHRDIREKILGIQPQVIITRDQQFPLYHAAAIREQVAQYPGVIAASPFIYGQILIRHGQQVTGAVIKGIDLDGEDTVVGLRRKLNGPALQSLHEHEILLGDELARSLGVRSGGSVLLMAPGQFSTVPRMFSFTIARTFHSGMYEYDATMAFVNLKAAQSLFSLQDGVSGVGAAVTDPDQAANIGRSIQGDLSYPYIVRSWDTMNRNLFAALKLEKIMMFIILTLIILVASFNIVSNLLMMSTEKSRDMGILSAMGYSRARIARIFMYEGLLLGMTGVAAGTAIGVGLSWLLKTYQFIHLPPDIYYLDALPVRIVPGDIGMIITAALAITIAAAVYPAYQVMKLDPVEAIRYG